MISWLKAKAQHRGLHGRKHIERHRMQALLMIITGLFRVICWLTLIVLYLLGVKFTKSLFSSVAFVALISLYANAATDWGQVAASLAQLTAGDTHADVEHVRIAQGVEFAEVEADIARLADLQPGPEATGLAERIRRRLHGNGVAE
jgi:hypothetical protein